MWALHQIHLFQLALTCIYSFIPNPLCPSSLSNNTIYFDPSKHTKIYPIKTISTQRTSGYSCKVRSNCTLEFPWSRVRGEGRWEPWESGEPVGKGFGGRPRGCRGRATVNVTTFVLVWTLKAMSGLMYHPDLCSSKAQIMHGARWLMHPLRQLRCVLFLKHLHALLSNGLMESWNSEVQ